uniref:Uncharacterized protein n=1 Tax=Arundo donax TaxID=35708 RepID=A0A0A9EAW8_ARUDO
MCTYVPVMLSRSAFPSTRKDSVQILLFITFSSSIFSRSRQAEA